VTPCNVIDARPGPFWGARCRLEYGHEGDHVYPAKRRCKGCVLLESEVAGLRSALTKSKAAEAELAAKIIEMQGSLDAAKADTERLKKAYHITSWPPACRCETCEGKRAARAALEGKNAE
jgi:hypothetical protein